MATKKQKREAGIARRERRDEELRRSNAAVLHKAREQRAYEEREEWREQHDKKHKRETDRISECPLCRDLSRTK